MVKGLTAEDILVVVKAALGSKGKEIGIMLENGYGILLEVDGEEIVIFTVTQHFFRMQYNLFTDFIFDYFKEVSPMQTEMTILKYREWADQQVEGN